jgi:ubiquinone/menaquinone biosynthesis C-methylase UbiE
MSFALDPEEYESRVIHELVDFRGKHVLEIGPGEGRLTWRFADRAATVLALDPNEARIEVARKSTAAAAPRSKVTFQVADVITAALPKGAFDVAVLSWSL